MYYYYYYSCFDQSVDTSFRPVVLLTSQHLICAFRASIHAYPCLQVWDWDRQIDNNNNNKNKQTRDAGTEREVEKQTETERKRKKNYYSSLLYSAILCPQADSLRTCHVWFWMMMMSWCLMSSDVIWHIRDKLWRMPKHGSIILYVHGNQKAP